MSMSIHVLHVRGYRPHLSSLDEHAILHRTQETQFDHPKANTMKILIISLGLSLLAPGAHSCCYPTQYEGSYGSLTGSVADGHGALTNSNARTSSDATLNKIVTNGTYITGTDRRGILILQDFNQHVEYIVENKTCTRAPLPQPMLKCIPANATVGLTFSIGPPANPISLRQFSFVVKGRQTEITVDGSCLPIFVKVYGESEDVSTLTIGGLRGATLGIKDPSVFNVPPECNRSTDVSAHDSELRQLLLK